jgi:ATP-binding cassette subfamily B (MDR/TAP) protein 1
MAAKDTSVETPSQGEASKGRKSALPQASVGETLRFVFECGFSTQLLFIVGAIAGVANGMVYPALAYLFSSSFSDISAASNDGLAQVRELAYTFLIVGAYALVASLIQGWCFEICSYRGCMNFRLKWFKALLRQDAAYFDVHDVAATANAVGPASNKFRRGLGRKFGEGIQFLCTGIFGLAYAFYSSWRVALVVLCVIPFVCASAMAVMTFNQGKGTRSAEAYSKAGSVAYTTVSSIRTVLSLNAIPSFIRQYEEATSEAKRISTSMLFKIGLANGKFVKVFLKVSKTYVVLIWLTLILNTLRFHDGFVSLSICNLVTLRHCLVLS